MEKEYPVWNHALKFGAYLSIFLVLIPIIVYLAGMDQQNNSLGFVTYILLFFGLAFSILQYRNTYNNGYIELGKAFSVGFTTGFVAAIITGIFLYFFFAFIAPEALVMDEDLYVENMLKVQPNMTEDQIEMSLMWAKRFMTPPWIAVMTIFMYTLFSAIFALIAALFTKKKNPEEEF